MNRYTDLFCRTRSNNKRIDSIDKIRKEHTFYNSEGAKCSTYHPIQKADNMTHDSFSIRMIAVMLILAIVMFLKQTNAFSENNVYESVMAEIHRQTTIEEIESMIKEDTVYPVMNWINGK